MEGLWKLSADGSRQWIAVEVRRSTPQFIFADVGDGRTARLDRRRLEQTGEAESTRDIFFTDTGRARLSAKWLAEEVAHRTEMDARLATPEGRAARERYLAEEAAWRASSSDGVSVHVATAGGGTITTDGTPGSRRS